jgi:hypothetical protein
VVLHGELRQGLSHLPKPTPFCTWERIWHYVGSIRTQLRSANYVTPPRIDSIRQTTMGGLILGSGFVWTVLACCAVSVELGVMIEIGISPLNESRN